MLYQVEFFRLRNGAPDGNEFLRLRVQDFEDLEAAKTFAFENAEREGLQKADGFRIRQRWAVKAEVVINGPK